MDAEYFAVIVLLGTAATALIFLLVISDRPDGERHPQRWVALGMTGVASGEKRLGWAATLGDGFPDAECIDLTKPGALLDDVRSSQVDRGLAAKPRVVVLWVGIEDLLSGVPEQVFLAHFTDLLGRIANAGCHAIIVGMPAVLVATDNRSAERRPADRVFTSRLQRWDESVRDVARSYAVTMVALRDAKQGIVARGTLIGSNMTFDDATLRQLARAIEPSLRRNLAAPLPDVSFSDEHHNSHDPAERRRPGLAKLT